MLSISHAVTGAFIATAVPNPALSIPLILAAHYLQDAVPHWDAGTGLSSGKKTIKSALLHEIPDLLLAALLVLLFFPLPFYNLSALPSYLTYPQVWGALLGILPDLLEAPRNFLRREPFFLRPLNKFHSLFHHSIPHVLAGLAPQVILLVLIWFLK